MERYRQTLDGLSWDELLREITNILAIDLQKLQANVNYYKSLFNKNNAGTERLNRFFEKLHLEKLRYNYFSELVFRLDESRYKFIILQLESCIQQETELQNKAPKDWVASVSYRDDRVVVSFLPL